jgi:hypothetical protein
MLLEKLSYWKISCLFFLLEDSIPSSNEPATERSPGPDESTEYPHTLLHSTSNWIYSPLIYAWNFHMVYLLPVFKLQQIWFSPISFSRNRKFRADFSPLSLSVSWTVGFQRGTGKVKDSEVNSEFISSILLKCNAICIFFQSAENAHYIPSGLGPLHGHCCWGMHITYLWRDNDLIWESVRCSTVQVSLRLKPLHRSTQ